MAETRTALRDAVQASHDARSLLLYVQAEVYPTREDMLDALLNPKPADEEFPLQIELPDDGVPGDRAAKRIGWLLDELVERGRLRRHVRVLRGVPGRKHREWVDCHPDEPGSCEFFSISDRGEAFLREWTLRQDMRDELRDDVGFHFGL